ncbi:MAG: hypothetical protein ACSHWU_11215 [Marinicella sp.]
MKISKTTLIAGLIATSSVSMAQQFYIGVGAINAASDLVLVDAETCSMTTIGPIGIGVTGLAVDSEGNLYASDVATPSNLMRVNQSTGAGLVIGPMGSGVHVPDLTFRGPVLYGWTENGDDLITVDTSTGVQTVIPSDQGSLGTGLAAASDGTLYLTPEGENGNPGLYTVDPVSGVTTLAVTLTGIDANGSTNALTFDDQDQLWASVDPAFNTTDPASLALIDHTTGTFSIVCSNLPISNDAIAYYGASDLIYKDGFGLLPFIQ